MRTDGDSGGGSAEARSPGAGAERPGGRSCVLIRFTPELRPEIPCATRRVLAVAADRRAVDERYQRPWVDPGPIGARAARCGCFVPRIAVDASEVELEAGRLGDVAHEPLGCTAVAFTERVRLVREGDDGRDVVDEPAAIDQMPLHGSHVLLHLVEQLLNFATARLSELAPLVLLHPHSADVAGPVVDVLEQVPVNRLQVLDTERALDVDETGTELLRPGRGGCAFPMSSR